jgi:hypothetical protein
VNAAERVHLLVPLVGSHSSCQVHDDKGLAPILVVDTSAAHLTLVASDSGSVTDADVEASWQLLDAMRVYVLALEAQREHQGSSGSVIDDAAPRAGASLSGARP